MNGGAWCGLAVMVISEAATLARLEPFLSWNTPICWTGFILFADSVVWQARRSSWIRSNPREFTLLALASIPLWIVFEGFNLVLRNWRYVGLPEHWIVRQLGYAWSFATIWPAMFEAAELSAVRIAGVGRDHPECGPPRAVPFSRAMKVSMAAGALMLILPFLVTPWVAAYLAAPVWLGFIFLLDPINARLGAESLANDFARGCSARFVNLLLAGLLCGVLWEFWNYWAAAKWLYTVPIMEDVKIFEMPLPGYLGFPAFAVECFTMYEFVRALVLVVHPGTFEEELGRRIAL
jgi:hypothetical protein